jgi:hypothetical protein
MAVGYTAGSLPPGIEDRVARFAELVSAAISNLESHAKVERLAAEQSALRRVATLVAGEHSPDDLFAALAEEIGVLLDVDAAAILRYEHDGYATTVAKWSEAPIGIELGERLPLDGENLAGEVLRTGMPQRGTHGRVLSPRRHGGGECQEPLRSRGIPSAHRAGGRRGSPAVRTRPA